MRALRLDIVKAFVAVAALNATGCEGVLGLDNPAPPPLTSGTGGTGGTAGSSGGSGTTNSGCSPGDVTSCYEGPEGTAGIGNCKAGTRTCLPDGAELGPCEAQTLPAKEDCSNPADEDCDGFSCSETLWVDQLSNIQAVAIAADRETGASYVVGTFLYSAQLGADKFDTAGDTDIFLAKLDIAGKIVWARHVGGTTKDSAINVECGNHTVTILAHTNGALNVEGTAVSVGVVVVRYQDDGTFVWARPCAGDVSARLGIDPISDDAILVGRFAQQLQCGSQSYSTGGDYDIFTTRIKAADGTEVKTKVWTNPGNQEPRSIAVDTQGSIYFAGDSSDPFMFGVQTVPNGMFYAKIAANNAPLWAKSFGEGTASGTALDAEGHVFLASACTGAVNDFGGGPIDAINNAGDICIAKLGGIDGSYVWARRFGAPGSHSWPEPIQPISVNSQGHIALAGHTLGAIVIDGAVVSTPGFVAQLYGDTGVLRWVRSFDFNNASITFSKQDALAVAGTFGPGTSDFGKGPIMTKLDEVDTFVTLIAP